MANSNWKSFFAAETKTFSRRWLAKVAYCPFYALHFILRACHPAISRVRVGVKHLVAW